MKIPKKIIPGLIAVGTAVGTAIGESLKNKIEENTKYNNIKHNGVIKYLSSVFLPLVLFLSILVIKESNYILFLNGLLSMACYVITILYCFEILKEKEKNTYKIYFLIGNMLMVITATLLFF